MTTKTLSQKWISRWRSKWSSFCISFACWLYRQEPQTVTCSSRIGNDYDCYVFLQVDGHNYVWLYKIELSEQTKRLVGFQAADPNCGLTLEHAAVVTQHMTKLELAAQAIEVVPRQDAA